MANRMVNTRFWDDNYTAGLDPVEKLMFLYFLTNTSTNISGIYEIPLKKIATDTGLDKEMVEKILGRFERDGKVFYRNGWLGLKNFIKNQNQNSPQVVKGIERELENAPEDIKTLILEGIDTLSYLTKLNLTKLNLSGEAENSPANKNKQFFSSKEEQTTLIDYLVEKGIPLAIAERELKNFIGYWTESNHRGNKQRWEMEKVFEIKRRLATWFSKVGQFNKTKGKTIV